MRPTKQERMVAVLLDGELTIHASGKMAGFDYATLCGLDGDDSVVGQEPAPLPRGAVIDCSHCSALFAAFRNFRTADFVKLPE